MAERRMRVFLAMDKEAWQAFKERRFGTAWFPGLLTSAQRLVNEGEIPSSPINRKTMGVKCDVALLERLIEDSQVRQRAGRAKKNASTREMILAGAV